MRKTAGFWFLACALLACDLPIGEDEGGGSSGQSNEEPDFGTSSGGSSGDAIPDTGTASSSGASEESTSDVEVELAHEGLIQSVDTGLCIGADSLDIGAALVSSSCSSPSALWVQAVGTDGSLELRVADQELCVTLASDAADDGSPLLLAECIGDATQRFEVGEGETPIVVASSGSCLDFNPGAGSGDPLKQWECHGMINQQFRFIEEPSGTDSLVQEIVDDMAEDASCPIAELVGGQIQPVEPGGYPSTQSSIVMGFMAHGQASPPWWSPSPSHDWVRNAAWPVVTPWIVALSCIDNGASETRIEMRNFRAFALLESTGDWEEVVPPSAVDGYVCPPGQWDNCGGATDITIEDGVTSVLAAGTGSNFHGWSTAGGRIDDASDVRLFVATVEARVVGPDVTSARYVLHVGTDYYPDDTGVNELGGYNPGAGFARSRLLGTDWETYSFATIDASPVINDPQWVTPTQTLIENPPPGFE